MTNTDHWEEKRERFAPARAALAAKLTTRKAEAAKARQHATDHCQAFAASIDDLIGRLPLTSAPDSVYVMAENLAAALRDLDPPESTDCTEARP
jgi:membrane protein involved in colicin uptake